MKDIFVIAPIKTPNDIIYFSKKSNCRNYYVYHHKFLNNNFKYVEEFISNAHKTNSKIYINFKHNITENELSEIKEFIRYLQSTKINGIFINNFAILEALKEYKLPFEIIIDSYFEIHNTSGIDFINNFHKASRIIITEEIYIKNVEKIKQCTNLPLSIDSDNLPWCAEEVKKSLLIDSIVIKGKFKSSEEILDGIKLIEKILQEPNSHTNQKLPFKHIRKCIYETNHFSGEIISLRGEDFKFNKYIEEFKWQIKQSQLNKKINYKGLNIPKTTFRLSSIEQVKAVKHFIQKIDFNPIYAIEFGEILSTSDLKNSSFSEIITEVNSFCKTRNIKFQLSTPRFLIERDFKRVTEYIKEICLKKQPPNSIVINNLGYLWTFINDKRLQKIPLEIGQGINLSNSMSINCIKSLYPIETIDFTSFSNIKDIEICAKEIEKSIQNRKLTIAGNLRIPSLGLCPLNDDSATIPRLYCKSPCRQNSYAIKDPSLDKVYPFIVDGFCRMHMFKDKLFEMYKYIPLLKKIGINEFVIDLSAIPAKFIPTILTNFINSLAYQNNSATNENSLYTFYQSIQ